jgi:hypothetical protein
MITEVRKPHAPLRAYRTIRRSFFLAAGLDAQSLTEHAAAAAGATIGTAAGKPLSNALGSIFGKLDKDTSQATGKPVKKVEKPAAPAPVKPAASGVSLAAPSSGASAVPDRGATPCPVGKARA